MAVMFTFNHKSESNVLERMTSLLRTAKLYRQKYTKIVHSICLSHPIPCHLIFISQTKKVGHKVILFPC